MPSRDKGSTGRPTWLDRLVGPVLLLSAVLLAAAWFMPLMTVRRFALWRDEVSIMDGIAILWDAGEYLLAAVLAVFAVAFPAAKLLGALALAWGAPGARRLEARLGWIDALGKWSMLDVFVVALVVIAVKLSVVADASSSAGLYLFAGSVLLSMAAVRRLPRLLARRAARV